MVRFIYVIELPLFIIVQLWIDKERQIGVRVQVGRGSTSSAADLFYGVVEMGTVEFIEKWV